MSVPVKRQLERSSEQWGQVDYRLQMATGKSSIHILSLVALPPPPQPQNFATEAVLHVTDLDRDYLDRAERNGLGPEEMVFYCGHINIHGLMKPGKVFTFLLCKVQLGRVGRVREAGKGADTVLLEGEGDAFQYNFMLNDRTRYFVEYEVSFTLANDKEFGEGEFPCMSCQNRRAKVYCSHEELQLCQECSKEHHGSRMMSGHQLQRLDKVNSLGLCPQHQLKLKHYCSQCCRYLCGGCLQKGSSHGSNDHPVAQIVQLYAEKREHNETVSSRQKDHMEALLRSLAGKQQEVQQNYLETKKAIEQVCSQALDRLEVLFSEKVLLLQSEEVELRMLNEKLEWAKTFMRFQEKNLKPIFYFQTQEKFAEQLTSFHPVQPKSLLYMKADLAVGGQLQVGCRGQLEEPLRESSRAYEAQEREEREWDYDSRAECPVRGELVATLQNSKLNFFCSNCGGSQWMQNEASDLREMNVWQW